MTNGWILKLGLGVAAIITSAAFTEACTTRDCAANRAGQVRCVNNQIETCQADGQLTYESCNGKGNVPLFCSAQRKACVTEEVLNSTSSSAGGGDGGAGGAGGDPTSGSAMGGGGTSSQGGMGGMGGTPEPTTNGCTLANAVDKTGEAIVQITFTGNMLTYTPSCVIVSAGTTVTWSSQDSNFAAHPLRGGVVVDGVKNPDGSSPILPTDSGATQAFSFPNAGTYGFYCDFHATSGMLGAVFVQ